MSDSPAPLAAPKCLNCGHGFGEQRPAYCPACGQDTVLRPPKLSEFVQQFGGAFVSTEGALWRTLGLLLARPGELTRRYLAGQRKHYVLPLRLYLTISVIVLLAIRLTTQVAIGDAQEEIENASAKAPAASAAASAARKPRVAPADGTVISIGQGRAGMRDGQFYCEGLPKWICRRLERRVDVDPKAMRRQAGELGERIVANLGAGMFLLLPGFAAALKLAYLNRRLRYTEHLVFTLHLHAFWFLMVGLMLAPFGYLTAVAALAMPIYTLLAMRRVYGGRWLWLLVRAGMISLGYLIILVVAMSGLALWALLG